LLSPPVTWDPGPSVVAKYGGFDALPADAGVLGPDPIPLRGSASFRVPFRGHFPRAVISELRVAQSRGDSSIGYVTARAAAAAAFS